jgi:paraquat-inducible protein B
MSAPEGADPGGPDQPQEPPAQVSRRHWLSWVWLAPAVAFGIVGWLGARSLAARGPEILVEFNSAEGLQPGETLVQYKGVNVGTVERVELTRDISRVVVHLRMSREMAPYLAPGARFWIVKPRVGAEGISGLATLVSGTYIEMYPGHGEPQTLFVGLEQPPLLQPDTAGRSFQLVAPELGSLSPGAPVNYHGLTVGQLQGYDLAASSEQVEIYVFVRAPYDQLVHPETRFWVAGGIDVTSGAQGVQMRVSSWTELLAGGIEFDTPPTVLNAKAAPTGSMFRLFDTRSSALASPHGPALDYRVRFGFDARGVAEGTAVELQGTDIGEVASAHLVYDPQRQSLYTDARLRLDPSALQIADATNASDTQHAQAVAAGLRALVARGLRARLMTSSFLTGQKVVALEMVADASRAEITGSGADQQLPTAPAADIDQILQSVQNTVHHLDRATAGPELAHAVKSLDETLTHLDSATQSLAPQLEALVASLREAAAAAQRTADAASGALGASHGNIDLPGLMRELNDAARAIRELADYLDRHPEALLRGRKGD